MKIKQPIFLNGIILLIAIGLTSCNLFKEIKISNIQSLQVVGFKNNKVDLVINAEIENPNNFNVTINKADLDISVNGVQLGSTSIDKPFKIMKKSKESKNIAFSMAFSELPPSAMPTLLSFIGKKQNEINLGMSGTIKAKVLLFGKSFPIAIEQKVPIRR